jgi:hypothetical protein
MIRQWISCHTQSLANQGSKCLLLVHGYNDLSAWALWGVVSRTGASRPCQTGLDKQSDMRDWRYSTFSNMLRWVGLPIWPTPSGGWSEINAGQRPFT